MLKNIGKYGNILSVLRRKRILPPQYFSAAVAELADALDSKSHSSVVTTSAEAFDFSRKFDNSICK